jgi:phospholipase C
VNHRGLIVTFLGAALLATSALAATPRRPTPTPSVASEIALLRQHVKHVFVLYQENRSFDSYFGTYPGAEGIYSRPAAQTPGFQQPITNVDGTTATIQPFRIGPKEYAADTDDVDHSHSLIEAKMNVTGARPMMDRFALVEERKYTPAGANPPLAAKQMGELTMAYEDCDTVPFLWLYAKRFVLFDHIFQLMTGPSTPGNLSIIGAQTGETQAILDDLPPARNHGDTGPGVPVLDDSDPFWGSPADHSASPMPVNPKDYPGYAIQENLRFATVPLTASGNALPGLRRADANADDDFKDVDADVPTIARNGGVGWGWYEEGYDREPTDPNAVDPVDANGNHASYVTHHNGPQFFGYVVNTPMRSHLHGLRDFYDALARHTLPASGVFYVKGGYRNIMGLAPADPDPEVQKRFLGDDDHPSYSDAQISEAMIAETVNAIARSAYWKDSAIVITWDDSEGDYDHVPPPILETYPGLGVVSDGPRIPLIVISPFAKTGAIEHAVGDTASVVKLVDALFGLPTLASLPDARKAEGLAAQRGIRGLGPKDAGGNGITDLLSAFDARRLRGAVPPLPASYAMIDEHQVHTLPQLSGFGCKAIGIVPVDVQRGLPNPIPADFNPRPKTNPTNVATPRPTASP